MMDFLPDRDRRRPSPENIAGFAPDGLIRVRHVHSFSLNKHPMNPRDFQFMFGRKILDLSAALQRNIRDVGRTGEKGDLDPIVPGLLHILESPFKRPILEDLIANTKLHEGH